MGELGRPASLAVAGVVVVALAACGSDTGSGSGDVAGSSPAPVSSPSSPAPSPTGGKSVVEVCSDLNAFATAAGPVFDLAMIALADGETPEERRTVNVYVSSMALHGVLLADHPEMGHHFSAVALAAADAKRKLDDGVPAVDALAALNDEPTTAARETAVAYRGEC
ncbi:hypothetical protein [Saccharothrix luteola]|uniref:hypothetical protein n=1 Tax=Saccharothrix luteola TaxID=2893018 RepID=UPI001E4DFA47|nr:hypothetical protein [Saccharothrix luteola]MCC8248497.1 hypothetical protein [Saccharothrix luteola]